jgi:hypothetical protein
MKNKIIVFADKTPPECFEALKSAAEEAGLSIVLFGEILAKFNRLVGPEFLPVFNEVKEPVSQWHYKGMPQLPQKQTFTPRVNRKTKKW